MSAREQILEAVTRANANRNRTALPAFSYTAIQYTDLVAQFTEVLERIGAAVTVVDSLLVVKQWLQALPIGKTSVYIQPNLMYSFDTAYLYQVDVAAMHGTIAVAENGAIWLPESNMGNRMLPFSTQQLVLIIAQQDIVHNMQEAYQYIDTSAQGYGVFIAGPSKTADIEQSLVIGAHGPIAMQVFIIKQVL
ncbi:MAG TPA: lactate utilization protein B/C [Chitinophagaceae bacterium]|nr:lactate utilization protein B/C [Chitinophagaceae bacterium]